MTGIGENTLAQPVKPPLRKRRACLAKLVKNRLTLTKKPSIAALSGLQPLADMLLTRPFRSHIDIQPGQR